MNKYDLNVNKYNNVARQIVMPCTEEEDASVDYQVIFSTTQIEFLIIHKYNSNVHKYNLNVNKYNIVARQIVMRCREEEDASVDYQVILNPCLLPHNHKSFSFTSTEYNLKRHTNAEQ